MKIKDILNESATDVVARFYKEASEDFDTKNNREAAQYKRKTQAYYDENFKQWFEDEITPVFSKPVEQLEPVYNTVPKKSNLQSPGYRGLQGALRNSGLPYDKDVQKYQEDPSRILAAHTMDAARTVGSK